MTIRVQHVIDLRDALQAAYVFKFPGSPYNYSDPVLNAGAAVKADARPRFFTDSGCCCRHV